MSCRGPSRTGVPPHPLRTTFSFSSADVFSVTKVVLDASVVWLSQTLRCVACPWAPDVAVSLDVTSPPHGRCRVYGPYMWPCLLLMPLYCLRLCLLSCVHSCGAVRRSWGRRPVLWSWRSLSSSTYQVSPSTGKERSGKAKSCRCVDLF